MAYGLHRKSLEHWVLREELIRKGRAMLFQLLHADPSTRPSADEALQHPWVRGDTPRCQHMDAAVRSLREFNARRKFRVSSQPYLCVAGKCECKPAHQSIRRVLPIPRPLLGPRVER